MRSALLIALAALLAGCAAPSTSPTGPSPTTAPTPTSPTRICEPHEGPQNPRFSCTEVIGKVLLAMGPEAGAVRVAWFRHESPCPPNARCMAPPPGSAYVVVRLESGATGIFPVRVAGAEAVIGAVTEPTFDIWPPSGEAIPEVGRPDMGPGAPAEIRDRQPLPLCGDGQVGVLERRAARSCFYGAVLDGRPAELHRRSADEAGGFMELYRYAGRGPVLVYQNRPEPVDPGWVRKDCAIGLPGEDVPGDDENFFVVVECLSTELS